MAKKGKRRDKRFYTKRGNTDILLKSLFVYMQLNEADSEGNNLVFVV